MEPIELANYYERQEALQLAVKFSQGRSGFTTTSVLLLAEQFLTWIKNEEGN